MSWEIVEAAGAEAGLVLALVTGIRGSAPRHAGAMMLFRKDGGTLGTVGGGRVELEAARAAAKALAAGGSSVLEVELVGEAASGEAPICGGRAEIVIEAVADRGAYAAAAARLRGGEPVVLVLELPGEGGASEGGLLRAVYSREGRLLAGKAEEGDRVGVEGALAPAGRGGVPDGGARYLRVDPADRLLVLGGGHVGLALARMGAELGFLVTVVDERPEYADPARFPAATLVVAGAYREVLAATTVGASTYAAIATPTHLSDYECVDALLGRGCGYLGFVGSRRKTRMILDRLLGAGHDPAEVAAVRAPIGVDIRAETPAEIALSILAEMVAARREAPTPAVFGAAREGRRG